MFVRGDGQIEMIGDVPVELSLHGKAVRRRATSILPVHRGKRLCFLALRSLFGERGRVAEWTRQWSGPWEARIYATGETMVFQSRRVALLWERAKLEELLER
jgi:hypothetical protein